MAYLPVDGAELYYEVRGDGPPLLLIAGLAFDSQSWQPITGELEASFRVIAVDNRGAGRTRPLAAPTSVRAMADDCVSLLQHLGVSSAHVLGHSMGGFVAQEMAIRYSERVDRLVLAATGAVNLARNNDIFATWAAALDRSEDPASWFRNIYYWTFSPRFFERPGAVDAAVKFAVDYPYPQTPRAFRNQINAIAAFDATPGLDAIRAPALVLAGRDDLLFFERECAEFAAKLPGAQFAAIENAGHSLHLEHPKEFAAQAIAFLSQA